MKEKNNRGFSLVELLATVVILGILSAVAIVGVNSIIKSAEKKHYDTQKNTMKMAAQSYTQDNRSSLPKTIGQSTNISLKTLQEKKYVGEINNRQGDKCDVDKSYVKVFKYSKDGYNYTSYLVCPGMTEEEDESQNSGPTIKLTYVDGSEQNISSSSFNKDTYSDPVLKLELTSDKDILSYNYIIYECFDSECDEVLKNSGSKAVSHLKKVTDNISIKEYLPLNFKLAITAVDVFGNTSSRTISFKVLDKNSPSCGAKTGEGINTKWINKASTNSTREITVKCVTTNSSECEREIYSQIFRDDAKYGTIKIKSVNNNINNCVVGVYIDRVEPTTPVINNPYINGSNNDFVITVTSSDATSGIDHFDYRYPNSSVASEKAWKQFGSKNKTQVSLKVTGERNETLEVRACDVAGNCSASGKTNIKITKAYNIKLDSTGATTKGTETIYIKPEVGIYLDAAFSKLMTTSANKITIPLRAGYTFEGYYTAKNGRGNQLINRNGYITSKFTKSTFTKNSTIYAYWKACGIGTYNTGSSNSCTTCPTCKTTLSVGATSASSCTWNYGDGSRNTTVSGYKNHLRINCYTGEYIGDTQQESWFGNDYSSYTNWGNYMMEDYSNTRRSWGNGFEKGGCETDILPNYGFQRYWMSQARLGNEINTIPTGRWQNYCGPGLIFNCNTTCNYGPLAYKTTSQYGLIYSGNRTYSFSSPARGEKTVFLHLRAGGGTRNYYISGLKFKVLNSSGGQIGYFTLKEMVANNYIKKLVLMDSQGASNGLNVYNGGNMSTSSWTGFVTIFMINPNYGVGGFQVYSNMYFATSGCDIGSGNCKDGWYYRYTDTNNWRMTTY